MEKDFNKLLWHIEFDEKVNRLESAYIISLIKLAEWETDKKFKQILDIPCGTGRLHPYLRKEGFEVYGIDVNESFIREAKEKFPEYANYYKVGDMRELNEKERYDVVLNWFTSFSYFDDETNLKVLENFYNALRKGGILILDTAIYNPCYPFCTGGARELDNNLLHIEFWKVIDEETRELHFQIYEKKSERALELKAELKMQLKIYKPKKIKEMLEKVGFEVLHVFDGRSIHERTKSLEGFKHGRAVFLARK